MEALEQKSKAELKSELKTKNESNKRRRAEEKEEEQAFTDVAAQIAGAGIGGAVLDDIEPIEGVSASWFGAAGSIALTNRKVRKNKNMRMAANAAHGAFLGKVYQFSKENNVFNSFNLFG